MLGSTHNTLGKQATGGDGVRQRWKLRKSLRKR
jgi:hypothetical protein